MSKKRNRTEAAPQGETRAGLPIGAGIQFVGGMTRGATPMQAENLTGVLACVNVIGTGLASLPARVYQSTPAGRVESPNHPVARLIRNVNPYQTWPDLIEWILAEVLLTGNALCEVVSDGDGQPLMMLPIPWKHVSPILLPNGNLVFDIMGFVSPWGALGSPRRLLAAEVFLLRDRGDNPFVGRSRLSRAPVVIASALSEQDFAASIWANQAQPSGAIKVPSSLNDVAFDRLRTNMDQRLVGTRNAGKTMILDNGAEWQSISISPEDAELLGSRKFTTEELCRLFQVPPPLVQDYSNNTFTNSQSAALWFAQFSLAPWAVKIEAEFARSIFGSGSASYSLDIDMSGLTRGDYAARWTSYAIAIPQGILTPDEVRETEGWPPRAVAAPPESGASS